jgi:hypothetical protein
MQKTFLYLMLVLFLVITASCTQSTANPSPDMQSIVNTSVAATLSALNTQLAIVPTETETPLPPTSTPIPTESPIPTTDTPTPLPAKGYILCDSAQFLGDITIPDDTIIPAGSTVKKIWALKNTSPCTWDTDYKAVFVSGDLIGSPASVPLTTTVPPGGTALVTVTFKVPADKLNQEYVSFWKLSDPAGGTFSGSKNKPFYVKFKTGETYNFLENVCSASWTNGNQLLYCPSQKGSKDGYFYRENKPVLENGKTSAAPALVMAPQAIPKGQIKARFAPVVVLSSYLHTDIGCMHNNKACDVVMGINYSIEGGGETNINEWTETYDGLTTGIDIDLGELHLNGKSVSFIFYVKSNSSGSEQSEVFWLNPRLGPK